MNTNKNLLIGLVILVVIVIGAFYFMNQSVEDIDSPNQPEVETEVENVMFNAQNATFTIDGESVTLVDGVSKTPIKNSSAEVTTRYFGNKAEGDLNGDGLEDQAFLVTQTTGGSGTFYYVAAALQTNEGYETTNAFFIGDRIAPQTTKIQSDVGELYVNYGARKEGEPMTADPSQGKTLVLKVTANGELTGVME